MHPTSIQDCKLIEISNFSDKRGSISFLEGEVHIPFPIKRIFYIYDVSPNESRGFHAHKETFQFFVCLSGSFCLKLNDGKKTQDHILNKPNEGILIPPLIWTELNNFTPNTICLGISSNKYQPDEYIDSFDTFLKQKNYIKD